MIDVMTHKKTHILIVYAVFLLISMCLTACMRINTNIGENTDDEEIAQIVRIKDADDFFAIKSGFVHFGKETCLSCKAFLPILSKVACDEKVSLYYFDTGYFREQSLLSESELQTIFYDYQIEAVPIVIKIQNGQTDDIFFPKFNEQKDNTTEVTESIKNFLLQQ